MAEDKYSPTGQARRRLRDVHSAHARLTRAWRYAPDHTLPGKGPDPGPTTGGGRSDPTGRAVAVVDQLRSNVLAETARITLELAEKMTDIDGDDRRGTCGYLTAHVRRPIGRQLSDVLALHKQLYETLARYVRELDGGTTYDDARELLPTVHHHASAIARCAAWAYGHLVRPNADPDDRVCDDETCQNVLEPPDGSKLQELYPGLCRMCASRRDRAAALRAAEVAREQARPLCPDCGQRLSEADVDDGHTSCLECRTPRCAGEIRDCNEPLKRRDIAANAANCEACRKHKQRHPEQVGTGGAFEWQDIQ